MRKSKWHVRLLYKYFGTLGCCAFLFPYLPLYRDWRECKRSDAVVSIVCQTTAVATAAVEWHCLFNK